MFTKGANLEDLMNIAHGVTTTIPSQVKNKVEAPIKTKVVTHEPSPSYSTDYMVTMDHNGKIVIKNVGAYIRRQFLGVCGFQKCTHITLEDPNLFGYLNSKLNLFCRPTPRKALHGCLIVDAQII
jgi:hypothetical protein